MKTYRFYILSRNIYITVIASHKWDAKQVVIHQFNTFAENVICMEICK